MIRIQPFIINTFKLLLVISKLRIQKLNCSLHLFEEKNKLFGYITRNPTMVNLTKSNAVLYLKFSAHKGYTYKTFSNNVL